MKSLRTDGNECRLEAVSLKQTCALKTTPRQSLPLSPSGRVKFERRAPNIGHKDGAATAAKITAVRRRAPFFLIRPRGGKVAMRATAAARSASGCTLRLTGAPRSSPRANPARANAPSSNRNWFLAPDSLKGLSAIRWGSRTKSFCTRCDRRKRGEGPAALARRPASHW